MIILIVGRHKSGKTHLLESIPNVRGLTKVDDLDRFSLEELAELIMRRTTVIGTSTLRKRRRRMSPILGSSLLGASADYVLEIIKSREGV